MIGVVGLTVAVLGVIVGIGLRQIHRRLYDLESRLAVAEADIRNLKGVGSA